MSQPRRQLLDERRILERLTAGRSRSRDEQKRQNERRCAQTDRLQAATVRIEQDWRGRLSLLDRAISRSDRPV